MTDTNEKIRSLFLTALMVFSVFAGTIAFSGGAAAAANVSIDQATEYDQNAGSNGGHVVEVVTNESINTGLSFGDGSSTGDVEVIINGTTNPDSYVDTSSVSTINKQNERVELVLEKDVTPDNNLTIKFNDVRSTTGDSDTDLVEKDIDVSSRTFIPATDLSGNPPANSRSYTNVYRGETIAVVDSGDDNSEVLVEEDGGSIVSDDTYVDNSEVYTLDTSNLDTGQKYNISVGTDSTEEAGFKLSDLNLNAEADDNDITDEDDVIANVTITRGGQPANATLFDDNGDKVDTILKDRLSSNDDTAFIFNNISSYNGFDADDGPYTVNVTDKQTGITVSTDQINVSESEDGDASFESSVVTDERGDVVNITYQLDNEDEAVVFVGDDDDDNYAVSGTIEDDDGDGEVTVSFNSYLAGLSSDSVDKGSNTVSADDVLFVQGDDEITGVDEYGSFESERTTLSQETIEASSYNLNVTAGTSQDSSADSVGTLRLSERSTESMRSMVAPRDAELDDDDIDIRDRIGQNLTESDEIANKSIVVHEITASGVEGALEYQQEVNGSNDVTQAFLGAGAQNSISEDHLRTNGQNVLNFSVEKTNVGANTDDKELVLNDTNTLVVDDPDNNTYFVAVKTALAKYDGGDAIRSQDDTDEIMTNFSVTPYGAFENENDGVEDDYSVVERDASIDTTNGLVTAQAAADQQITGTTSVAPGAEVEVEVESQSESNPFLERPETTVNTDGTFAATVDFNDQSAGTNFTTQFLDTNGDELGDEEDGRLTDAATGTVSISDQESDGSEVVVDSAQLSAGGFIAIHAGNASGDVVGNSEYRDAGSHEDITITLDEPMDEDFTAVAMPHLDTNGNEAYDFPDADGPYTANGSAVTDSANVTVGTEEEPTATETETEEETDAPATDEETDAPATDEPATEESETTAEEGPGFTAAIALIALVAAALLAVRRDN